MITAVSTSRGHFREFTTACREQHMQVSRDPPVRMHLVDRLMRYEVKRYRNTVHTTRHSFCTRYHLSFLLIFASKNTYRQKKEQPGVGDGRVDIRGVVWVFFSLFFSSAFGKFLASLDDRRVYLRE
ncbi:hypothetical protein VTN77DRAFT_4135 [Rasamsonia byssochlamydoides]|uniref:uncharacterized protein n=1 Tax=Rasamsonia byssochlamydoides TaxID=89139 RepID=UPI0037430359